MKTFKSIQKNQAQLNSLLMEKWGHKNTLTEEKFKPGEQDEMAKKPSEKKKFEPGEQDEKAKKSSEQKKKESPKDIRAKYAGKHVDPGEQDEKYKKPSEREKFDPGKKKMEEQEEMDFDDEFEPATGVSGPDINSDAMAATLDTASAPVLEEEHNCRSAHPGMNHDQWANKHR